MTSGEANPDSNDAPDSLKTDSRLVDAAKRMEPDAWRQLVDRYSWLVFQWCRNSGLSHENAADVVQVVLGQVAVHLPRFRKDGAKASFRRWLRSITRSKIVDFYRAEARQPRGEGGQPTQAQLNSLPADEDSHSAEPDPVFERFWKLIERLEDKCDETIWQAFWLTTIENRTSTEAAGMLKMTPNAVRLAKARVLQRLRAEAAVEMADPPLRD